MDLGSATEWVQPAISALGAGATRGNQGKCQTAHGVGKCMDRTQMHMKTSGTAAPTSDAVVDNAHLKVHVRVVTGSHEHADGKLWMGVKLHSTGSVQWMGSVYEQYDKGSVAFDGSNCVLEGDCTTSTRTDWVMGVPYDYANFHSL